MLFFQTVECAREKGMTARLTHGFEKRLGKTREGKIPAGQIRHAEWVQKSDIEYSQSKEG